MLLMDMDKNPTWIELSHFKLHIVSSLIKKNSKNIQNNKASNHTTFLKLFFGTFQHFSALTFFILNSSCFISCTDLKQWVIIFTASQNDSIGQSKINIETASSTHSIIKSKKRIEKIISFYYSVDLRLCLDWKIYVVEIEDPSQNPHETLTFDFDFWLAEKIILTGRENIFPETLASFCFAHIYKLCSGSIYHFFLHILCSFKNSCFQFSNIPFNFMLWHFL